MGAIGHRMVARVGARRQALVVGPVWRADDSCTARCWGTIQTITPKASNGVGAFAIAVVAHRPGARTGC